MDDVINVIDKVYICLSKKVLDENDKIILNAYANAYYDLVKMHINSTSSLENEQKLQVLKEPYMNIFNKNILTVGEQFLLDIYNEKINNDVSQSHENDIKRSLANGHNILDENNYGFFHISSILLMTILLGFILAILLIYIK